jgi:SAM-dependent methyltransferase
VTYFLKSGYIERLEPEYWHDEKGDTVWQPDVYEEAGELARRVGAKTLVDIGCGNGAKLAPLADEFAIVGVDFGPNIEECRRRYSSGTWLDADLDAEGPLEGIDPHGSVVVCADVAEHLVRPERLLRKLRGLLESGALALILTTPDRDLRRGAVHHGPSPNPAHVREWSSAELGAFMRSEGLDAQLGLTRTNDASPFLHTIFAAVPGPALGEAAAQFKDWWRYRDRWQQIALDHEALYTEVRRSIWLRAGRRVERLAGRS